GDPDRAGERGQHRQPGPHHRGAGGRDSREGEDARWARGRHGLLSPPWRARNEAAERPPRLFVGIPSPRGHRTGLTPTVRTRAWRAAPAPTEPSGGRPPAPRG